MMDPAPYYRKIKDCLDGIDDFLAKRGRHVATYQEVNMVEIARQCIEALEGDPAAQASLLVLGAIDPDGLVVCTKCGGMMRANHRHSPPLYCPECG